MLSGNEDALEPIVGAIHELVHDIGGEETAAHHSVESLHEDTLVVVLMAMGDAVIGAALSRSLRLPETAAREVAQRMLEVSLEDANQQL